MKALVTGSAGFVGRHLVPKLRALSYEVSAIDCAQSFDVNEPFPFRGTFISSAKDAGAVLKWRGGIQSYLVLANSNPNLCEPFDVVVHLAANIVNVDARMRGGMDMYSDIELDLAMCRWLEKNPPKQCAVLMSSCAVDYPSDPYCIVKRNLESFAQTLHKKGVPVIVLRPFSGYGEDQTEEYPFRAILERALRKEDPLTVWGGCQTRDWLHIDDLTDAIMFAVKELPRRPDPVEVGTRKGTCFLELAEMMAEAVEYTPKIFADETKAASSLRRVAGENGQALLQAWGWSPKITLEDAIARAVASHKKVETSCRA